MPMEMSKLAAATGEPVALRLLSEQGRLAVHRSPCSQFEVKLGATSAPEGSTEPALGLGLRGFEVCGEIGGRTRARTWDPLIKSQLLYQLSYAPGSPRGKPRQARVT